MKTQENETEIIKKTVQETFSSLGSALLGPLWEVKNALQTCYGGYKELSFNAYLKSLYKQLENNGFTKADVEKYTEEIKKENSNQYISNILDSLFFSKCILSSQILGMITAKYLIKGDLDYCDLYLVAALDSLYDTDLNTFVHVFMHNQQMADTSLIFDDSTDNESFKSSANSEVFTLDNYTDNEKIILDKLQNLNIFGRDRTLGRLSNGISKPLFYEKTEVSKRLLFYYHSLASAYD